MAKYVLHYLDARPSLAQKALIAAKFNGIAIETKVLKNVTDKDVKASPVKTLPFLETDFGCVFASNAIARYIARNRRDTGLHGDSFEESVDVDSWCEFTARELEVPGAVLSLLAKKEESIPITKEAYEMAKSDLTAALVKLETRLKTRKFLVGHQATLADISVICALADAFAVVDAAFRKPYPKTMEWFNTLVKTKEFASVLKDVKLADKEPALTFSAAPAPKAAPKQDAPKAKQQAAAPAAAKAEAKAKAKAAASPTPASPKAAASASGPASPEDQAKLDAQKEKVRELKTSGASADEVTAAVAELKRLKEACGEVDPPKDKKKKGKK